MTKDGETPRMHRDTRGIAGPPLSSGRGQVALAASQGSPHSIHACITQLLIHMGLLKVCQKERGPRRGVHPNIQHLESGWGCSPTVPRPGSA